MFCFFTDHLKNMSLKQHIVVEQLAVGLPITRSLKFKYILNSTRIRNSTTLLLNGALTVNEFLVRCSYVAETYIARELDWQLNEEDGV